MTESRQSQELNQAANRLADVTNDLRVTVERLLELEREKARPRGVPEEEAVRLAQEGVRQVRPNLRWEGKQVNGDVFEVTRRPQPSAEEIEQWQHRREQRRQREGYYSS